MAAYSMDLRTRVLRDWDEGLKAEDVAAKYRVSRAWVHRLVQRRRETGEIGPRRQTRFRAPALAGQEDRLRFLVAAQPDRTLAELRAALPTSASLATIWRTLDRLRLTVKPERNEHRRIITNPGTHLRTSQLARVPYVGGSHRVKRVEAMSPDLFAPVVSHSRQRAATHARAPPCAESRCRSSVVSSTSRPASDARRRYLWHAVGSLGSQA